MEHPDAVERTASGHPRVQAGRSPAEIRVCSVCVGGFAANTNRTHFFARAFGPYASRYVSRQGFGGLRPAKNVFVVRDGASFAGTIAHDTVK